MLKRFGQKFKRVIKILVKQKINGGFKLLFLLPFLLIALIAFYKVDLKKLITYNTSFISISLTIATFSISFSFLQYQFSPYKALLKSISSRQLVFSYFAILAALIPLFTLFFSVNYVPVLSLFIIPLLAYMSILLWVVANEESNPLFLLRRIMSKKNYRNFIDEFKDESQRFADKQTLLNFSKYDEEPMHDYGELKNQPIPLKNDPYGFINNTIEITLKNRDTEVFEKITVQFFNLLQSTATKQVLFESDFRFRFQGLVESSFSRLAYSISQLSENKIYQNRFLEIVGTYLKQQALKHEQVNNLNVSFIQVLTGFAKSILNTNSKGALYIIAAFRQLCQKGIYDNPKENAKPMFDIYLATFPVQIKIIGQEAIRIKDSDFLYRCLEELGYMGCTAIKANHYNVAIECLQSLVQLGREARANDIKCFWTHCMLETIDHAEERIWWMLTWVPYLEEKSVNNWTETFSIAYSRLHGYKRTISVKETQGRIGFEITKTLEKHVEGFSKEHYHREVDYSDLKEIKEFKLY